MTTKKTKKKETQEKSNGKIKLKEPKQESVEMPHKDTNTEANTWRQKSLRGKSGRQEGAQVLRRGFAIPCLLLCAGQGNDLTESKRPLIKRRDN